LEKHCGWKLQTKASKIAHNCVLVDEMLVTQQAHLRLTAATAPLIEMATAGGGVVPAAGTVATDARRDSLRLLTVVMDKLEIHRAVVHTRPIHLALQKSAILCWNGDFIFLTADAINKMTCGGPTAHMEIHLEMAHKLQL